MVGALEDKVDVLTKLMIAESARGLALAMNKIRSILGDEDGSAVGNSQGSCLDLLEELSL